MPIRHCIVHFIDKKPDGNPAALHSRDAELEHNEAADNLLADLNDAYNAKATKGWGLFLISNITTIIVQDLHAQELFPKIHELKRAELKFVRANLARMSRLGYVCAHGERSEPKAHSQ